jgi:carboxyl-terminal processing protease
MGSKKLQVWLPLLFAITMVVGMYIGYGLNGTPGSSFFNRSGSSSLQEVLDLVRNKYVDAVPFDSINNVAVDELLSHLDPHSVFIPAAELKEVNEDLMGNFQGIGVEFQVFSDSVNVVSVIKDGPADKAGLQVGDVLLKANDSILFTGKKIKADDIRKQLRGPAGSSVKITVWRSGSLKNIFIKRGSIPVPSVDAAYLIAPKTGYLRINKFGERTYEEFMQQMEKLQKRGMTQLILDLRGNGGGLMDEAIAIADEFLDGEKLIVYTQGNKSPRVEYHCKKDGLFEKGKLVVLVDETSASASEVLTGALQDWDRATIVGRRTFGKGLVQQQFQLSDGSALRLTVARYYSPLGRNIQKSYAGGKEKYQEELMDRYHDGELIKEDTTRHSGPSFKTPAGHIVYGGGGITPDIFVSFDTAAMQQQMAKLYYKNTINHFVYQYYLQNRNYFQSVRSSEELEKQFRPGDKEWKLFSRMAIRDTVSLTGFNSSEKVSVLKRIQELMARQILGNEGFIEVTNQNDPVVKRGLELLNGPAIPPSGQRSKRSF